MTHSKNRRNKADLEVPNFETKVDLYFSFVRSFPFATLFFVFAFVVCVVSQLNESQKVKLNRSSSSATNNATAATATNSTSTTAASSSSAVATSSRRASKRPRDDVHTKTSLNASKRIKEDGKSREARRDRIAAAYSVYIFSISIFAC